MLASSDTIAETDHSVIEKCYHNNQVAVLKRARDPQNSRAAIRWRSEIDMLQSIGHHPNVTQLLASDLPTLTLTLRLEPGQPLSSYITSPNNSSTLTRPECTHLLSSLSSALCHLHTLALPIIHADIKPENIMFSRSSYSSPSRFVLIDFGAAFYLKDAPEFNPSGTPSYVAPEFLQRHRGKEMDVWALGMTMLWALGRMELPDGEGIEGVVKRTLEVEVGERIGSVELEEMAKGMMGG